MSLTRRFGAGVVLLLALACGKSPAPEAAETPAVQVSPENLYVVDSGRVESGPALSGTLDAERQADLRAQVGGSVLAVYVEEGAQVAANAPLVQLDTVTLAEAARSARSQLRSADAAAQVAQRNAERSQTLHAAGAIADRDLEAANNARIAAEANLADARSRLASAEKMLNDALVRAPWAGIVSDRSVNAGDVVQPGATLVSLVNPATLKLEAAVAADQAAGIRPGAKVEFSVTGYAGKRVTGTIARVNPVVDPTTRQIRIYAQIPNEDRSLAVGVFAEGRIATASAEGLAIPLNAMDTRAIAPSVKRVRGGTVESAPVELGVRDDFAERIEVKRGLARGDTLLIGGVLGSPVGARVQVINADH
jgi:RND family efflux transporter MFP subunit